MAQLRSGLVSVTFRQLTPSAIITLMTRAGLDGIEWGGDVHVPHGDLVRARQVRQQTLDANLACAAYGSYYRVGHEDTGPFAAVLTTAIALGAPSIRVWAGKQGSVNADAAYHTQVIEDSRRIASLAAAAGLPIVYEFHANTLTDSSTAARSLLESVDHTNLKSYWQPPRGASVEDNLAGLDAVLPWLHNVHVFNWHMTTGARLPLHEGEQAWLRYLAKVATAQGEQFAMLEFVADDAPENFLRDAATLKEWLAQVNQKYEGNNNANFVRE